MICQYYPESLACKTIVSIRKKHYFTIEPVTCIFIYVCITHAGNNYKYNYLIKKCDCVY